MSDYRDESSMTGNYNTNDIETIATAIRQKKYGKDTREAMAQSLEKMGALAMQAVTNPNSAAKQAYDVGVGAYEKANAVLNFANNELVHKISQIDNGVHAYANVDAIKQAYPNGKDGIFIAADTGHQWYWINGSWIDAGAYQTEDFALSSYVDMKGFNLLKTSPMPIHYGPGNYGYDSEIVDISNRNTNDLIWITNINLVAGKYYPAVAIFDESGSNLSMDGSKTSSTIPIPIGATTYTNKGRNTHIWRIKVPYNAKKVSVSIASPDTALEFYEQNKTLVYSSDIYQYNSFANYKGGKSIYELAKTFYEINKQDKLDANSNPYSNLLHNSSVILQNSVGSHDTEFINWRAEYGNILTYAVDLENIRTSSQNGVYLTIRLKDAADQFIDLNGNIMAGNYFNIPIENKTYTTNTKIVKEVVLPYNANQVSITLTTNDDVSFDYNNERLIAGKQNNLPVDKLTTSIKHFNLMTGTNDYYVQFGPGYFGKDSDIVDIIGGKTLFWTVKLKNIVGGHIYPAVMLWDNNGKRIDLSGNVVADTTVAQPIGATDYNNTKETIQQFILITPENAKRIKTVLACSSDSVKFEYASEVLRYSNEYDYEINLNDVPKLEALEKISEHLYEKIENINLGNIAVLVINGNATKMLYENEKTVLPFVLKRNNKELRGYTEMCWQGNSSLSWAKKGFKFKTYEDKDKTTKLYHRPKPTFYKASSFNLKGYLTDKWSIRDSVSAEILSRFIANNDTAPYELLSANHFGTIQTMPVLLYFQNQFYGLMEMNTKSGSLLWNMDSKNANHIAIEAGGGINSNWNNVGIIGSDWYLESDNDTKAAAAQEALGQFIVNSSDSDFVNHFEEHINKKSVADYIIFNYLVNNMDAWQHKNTCYLTYDAKKWYLMGYDFDCTFGAYYNPDGTIMAKDTDYFNEKYTTNRLFKRFYRLMPDVLLARFNELESKGILNITDLVKIIDDKANAIGIGAYELEWDKWAKKTGSYAESMPNLDDMKAMLIYRKQLLKTKIKEMQK